MKFCDLNFVSLTVVILTISHNSRSFDWNDDKSSGVRWAMNCKFPGNDLKNISSRGEDCSSHCSQNTLCSHFDWTRGNEGSPGTCWLKSIEPPFTEDFESSAIFEFRSVCGYFQISWTDATILPGRSGSHWALNCFFVGNGLEEKPSKGEECGPRCEANRKCTHFTWLPRNGGRCFMKTGATSKGNALFYPRAVCGIVERKPVTSSTTISSSSDDCTCTCEA